MAEEEILESIRIGSIVIGEFLAGEDKIVDFKLDGITTETAIGMLTITLDRLREEAKYSWPTCPGCGESYDSHDEEEEE